MKSVLIGLVLLVVWALWIFNGPEEWVSLVNSGLSGWFMGTLIYNVSAKLGGEFE